MADWKQVTDVFHGDTLESIHNALTTLADSGFWDQLVRSNQYRLLQSFESADEVVLARQIREMRDENRVYLTLQSLAPPAK